jgi:Fic family protein
MWKPFVDAGIIKLSDIMGYRNRPVYIKNSWHVPPASHKLMDYMDEYFECLKNEEYASVRAVLGHFFLTWIHPFNDGNGRMSRLLTLLLLYRSGYFVGKYISIERLIADSKETYYEVLQESSTGWHEGENDYLPFVRYMLGVVIAAYREFASRVDILITGGLSKPDRVREIIRSTTGKITKTQIMRQCPDISQKTVERALAEMLKNGDIIKISGGRYTSYTWNWEKE